MSNTSYGFKYLSVNGLMHLIVRDYGQIATWAEFIRNLLDLARLIVGRAPGWGIAPTGYAHCG